MRYILMAVALLGVLALAGGNSVRSAESKSDFFNGKA